MEYESIKQKIRKLAALAERGVRGEAENAQRLLESLCQKYGLSVEDILDQNKEHRYRFDIGRRKIHKSLFMQCYAKVTGKGEMSYWNESRSEISLMLTAYQYAELVALYEWHKAHLERDIENHLDLILEAYVSKHRLFRERTASDDDSDDDYKLTPEDLRRAAAILAMRETLGKETYQKMLTQ